MHAASSDPRSELGREYLHHAFGRPCGTCGALDGNHDNELHLARFAEVLGVPLEPEAINRAFNTLRRNPGRWHA